MGPGGAFGWIHWESSCLTFSKEGIYIWDSTFFVYELDASLIAFYLNQLGSWTILVLLYFSVKSSRGPKSLIELYNPLPTRSPFITKGTYCMTK